MFYANLSKNYVMLCFEIHFNYLFKHCSSLMGHLKETKLTSANFPKKNSFKGRWVIYIQFGPKLQHPISHELPYSKDVFENCGMREHSQTIEVLVNFPKKSPFQGKRQFGPNFAQNYSTLYLMISRNAAAFWNILAWWGKIN